MANPFVFMLGVVLIIHGALLRQKAMAWTYRPGHWSKRWTFGPVSPSVTYFDGDQTHTAHVSRFATLYEDPLRLLVSEDGRRAHIAGSEFSTIGLGAMVCLLQLLTIF